MDVRSILVITLALVVVVCSSTVKKCVRDCREVADGNYQDCDNCHVYVSCSNGRTFIRPCPERLEYDSNLNKCVGHSKTCHKLLGLRALAVELYDVQAEDVFVPPSRHCASTGANCVSDCTGKKDGDYQSCHGCDVYVTCSNGLRYDDRPCAPGGLVWDDNKKRCEWNSTTCDGCEHKDPCSGTGPACKKDCKGLKDGDYQSCYGCQIYLSCVAQKPYDKRPCAPGGTYWDDNKKRCDWYSNTCFKC